MNREIVKYPDSVLRKKAEEIEEITPEIKELALDMVETMVRDQGIGLAAPQIGQSRRIIAVHLIGERSLEEKAARNPQIFINPKIIKKGKEVLADQEGCLSFPGLFLKIKRAKWAEVEALTLEGEKVRIKVEGLPARIFQHEIDHLNGILFIDRISFWQRLWRLSKN